MLDTDGGQSKQIARGLRKSGAGVRERLAARKRLSFLHWGRSILMYVRHVLLGVVFGTFGM